MSRGINKVILIGNAGNDAEVRAMPSGAAVANVNIATSESWKDKQTGQMQERTEWHRVVFMDRGNFQLGKIAGDYIKKGSKVYIEGSLKTREWEKDGVKRYTTEIVANEMQLLDGKPNDDGQQQQQPKQSQGGVQQGGSWGKEGFTSSDPWLGYVGVGKCAGMPIDKIKSNSGVQGDFQTAINKGLIAKAGKEPSFDDFDDSIPF